MSTDEYTETIELDEEDQTALDQIMSDAQAAPEFSLLRVWAELLSNIEEVEGQPIPMYLAGQLTSVWPKLSFQDIKTYHELYHGYLSEVRDLLHEEIKDNPGCLDHEGDEDAKENARIYRDLVVAWNVLLDAYEREWRTEDEDSHIRYAALVDVRRMLFARDGLAGHLEARGVSFDEDEIRDEIMAAREQEETSE